MLSAIVSKKKKMVFWFALGVVLSTIVIFITAYYDIGLKFDNGLHIHHFYYGLVLANDNQLSTLTRQLTTRLPRRG